MADKIFIAGSGGIGIAAAIMLREWSRNGADIFLGDISSEQLDRAAEFVARGSAAGGDIHKVLITSGPASDEMSEALDEM